MSSSPSPSSPLISRQITVNSSSHFNRLNSNNFIGNKIRTTKYTLLTFIPIFLWDQFSKPANFYFLVISSLQQFESLSPTGRWGTLVPLVLSVIVSAIKEILEDSKRSRDDKELNLRKVLTVQSDGRFLAVPLESLKVGQLVRVLRDELIPADLLLLQSSENDGLGYLETAAIDGESNLKLRQAHPRTQHTNIWDKSTITCDPPNNQIYTFQGSLQSSSQIIPLDCNQFLPRGSVLVNTEWIVGAVLYTGKDTKIMQNVKPAPRKITKMDRLNDQQTLQIVIILVLLVFILFCGNVYYNRFILPSHGYLHKIDLKTFSSYFANLITFLLLLNNLVPISLSVTLEIVRSLLAHLIDNDLEMYDEELQLASKARSSNVLDELGRIEYIMTDKTGTLTCNKMTLKHLLINTQIYNNCLATDSPLISSLKLNSDPQRFIQCMALCHTVMIDKRDHSFQASSPDELALLQAAKALDCSFISRSSENLQIRNQGITLNFVIKAVIEFTSDRKRMSTVLQDITGRYFMISKGADSVIFSRAAKDNDYTAAARCVEEFSVEGLRTLCFAYREISNEQFNKWYPLWTEAINTIGPTRQTLLDSAADAIECNLSVIGVSGIEDLLQVGVPQAISTLLNAKIRIWILTGDRAETATNTAFLCGLLKPHHSQIKILTGNSTLITQTLTETLVQSKLNYLNGYVLIVSGDAFDLILKDSTLSDLFLSIVIDSRTLIACRLSPLQKAQITQFVQFRMDKTTLAIGDGGNDVGMIQVAHVGVGINGLEGTQAARSADFSIPKFRFIVKLLLIHGAWSFHRISRVILYTLYKNFVIVLCQFWFAYLNSYSAQTAFSPKLLLLYNSVFSVAPPVIIGITDQYVTAPELIKHPQLYTFGQKGKFYNRKAFWECIVNAIIQSFTLCISFYFFIHSDSIFSSNFQPLNLEISGSIFYFTILLTISLKVLLFTNYFTNLMSVALISALLICLLVILMSKGSLLLLPFSSLFYASIILIPIFTLLRDFLWKFYRRQFRPRAYHIVQEMRAVERKYSNSRNLTKYSNSSIESSTKSAERIPLRRAKK